ncbi:MAG: hypothetical protein KF901_04405 [Myxococcales bacterium]|nr:hypothetical protein [Myxococcales bacterium]
MRWLLALLVVLSAASAVEAQSRRGALLEFRGWRGSQARAAALRGVRDRLDLVSTAEIRNTGADTSSAEGLASVAQQLAVTVFIRGDVQGRGARARTTVRVYDASGNEVAQRQGPAPLGGARVSAIARAASEALDQALVGIERREAEARERERQREMEELRRAQEARDTFDDEPPPSTEDDGVEDPHRLPLIVALVGLDGRTRRANIDLAAGGGREYQAGIFPSLTLALQLFPLRGMRGAARGLYAQVDFGYSLGLSSQELDAAGNPGPTLATTAMQFGAHVGYLYPLDEDVARIGAIVGYGLDNFSIESNGTMASSSYGYLRIGAVADVKLYERLLRARLDVGYRITLGTGELSPTFGEDVGVGGFDIGVALQGRLDFGLTYGARLGFTRYGLTFEGPASGHPAAAQATEMVDKALNFGLQLGFAY